MNSEAQKLAISGSSRLQRSCKALIQSRGTTLDLLAFLFVEALSDLGDLGFALLYNGISIESLELVGDKQSTLTSKKPL